MNPTKKHISHAADAPAQTPDFPRWFRCILTGLGTSLAAGLILSFLAAAVSFAQPDPDALTLPLGIIAAALSFFIGGFATAKGIRRQPLVCGLVCGALLLVLWFFFSCFLPEKYAGGMSAGLGIGLRVGMLLFSLLGALLATNAPRKKNRRHRKPAR